MCFTSEDAPRLTGTHVLDARHARWLRIYTKKTGPKTKTANNLSAKWQQNAQTPIFTIQNGEVAWPPSGRSLPPHNNHKRKRLLLLRNSIEEEEEEEEEEEDEDLFESNKTIGTHPPAPPDR